RGPRPREPGGPPPAGPGARRAPVVHQRRERPPGAGEDRRGRRTRPRRDPEPSGRSEVGMSAIAPVRWETAPLVLLDQTVLPEREIERDYRSWPEVGAAIRTLVVRGAPAIGVAAAFGVGLAG